MAYNRMTPNAKFEYLKSLYLERSQDNDRAYEEMPEIFEDARETIEEDARRAGKTDTGQVWRAWKGKNYEKLVNFIVSDWIESELPLKVIEGSRLERRQITDDVLSKVKRNLLVDFGVQGCFLPDADIVVYDPQNSSVKAIISCKTSLRERVAQTGFWKRKLMDDPVTRHIKTFFATTDGDSDFFKDRITKGAAIAIEELDAVYVVRKDLIERYNVRTLDKIIEELRKCL